VIASVAVHLPPLHLWHLRSRLHINLGLDARPKLFVLLPVSGLIIARHLLEILFVLRRHLAPQLSDASSDALTVGHLPLLLGLLRIELLCVQLKKVIRGLRLLGRSRLGPSLLTLPRGYLRNSYVAIQIRLVFQGLREYPSATVARLGR